MFVFRVTHRRYAKTPLDGEGSFLYGGRWNSVGVRIAYTSGTVALAQLEYLVGLHEELLPSGLTITGAEIPNDVAVTVVSDNQLPKNWREFPAPVETRAIGDAWANAAKTAILSVPSVHVPLGIQGERNLLINPGHAAFRQIRIREHLPFAYDERLRKRGEEPKYRLSTTKFPAPARVAGAAPHRAPSSI